jgi:hypothetical protein
LEILEYLCDWLLLEKEIALFRNRTSTILLVAQHLIQVPHAPLQDIRDRYYFAGEDETLNGCHFSSKHMT